MKVTKELIHITYDIAKEVYEGKISRKEGVEIIIGNGRMNPNSATDLIYNIKHLLDGEKYTRRNNTYATDYFLQNIHKDYGFNGLSNALRSLKKHIIYYENKQNVTMHSIRKVYSKYQKIKIDNPNEFELEGLIKVLNKRNKTKQQIIEELSNLKPSDPEYIKINSKSYKRDNVTIAKIKILRDFKCQICGERIKKKDGSFYIEAAHIKAKHLGGNELPNNIILLCPNHHKEFDYGNHEKLEHTAELYRFNLNGEEYTIPFEIGLETKKY